MTTSLEMADEMENVYSMELGYGEIEKQDRYEVRYKVGQNPERNRKISSKLLGKPKSKEHRKAMSDNRWLILQICIKFVQQFFTGFYAITTYRMCDEKIL